MNRLLSLLLSLLALTPLLHAAAPKPLRALIITGGCCHDYAIQHIILKEGLEARAHLEVDTIHSADRTTRAKFEKYEKPDWAKGYDVIVHDECSSDVKDVDYVTGILAAHRAGIPAVNLHCAMHSYRVGDFRQPVEPGSPDSLWFDLLGLQSTGHGPQAPIAITVVNPAHPTMKGLAGWTTINEELYNNIKIFPTATPLMRGKQVVKRKDGTESEVEAIVTWVNNYHGTRIFSSTLGHNNATVGDPRYLDMVIRGLLWSCDKLNDTYLKPAPAEPVPPSAKPYLEKAASDLKQPTAKNADKK